MFSIRLHGRGGQGMKTASHFLGNAFFLAGFEVQDAPRYGAERRGAPITSYVRADRKPIYARGIISNPGLVVVADDSLIPIASAAILKGLTETTVLLIVSVEDAHVWQQRLNCTCPIKILPPQASSIPLISASCAGASARLCGVILEQHLMSAIEQELEGRDKELIELNKKAAVEAFRLLAKDKNSVRQVSDSSYQDYKRPDWIELPLETSELSAPVIHKPKTSVKIRTGLWRTERPIIDHQRCNRCWWVCSSSCPDSVINIDQNNRPVIDYEHCKGCMICVAQCPAHAITSIPELEARMKESK